MWAYWKQDYCVEERKEMNRGKISKELEGEDEVLVWLKGRKENP